MAVLSTIPVHVPAKRKTLKELSWRPHGLLRGLYKLPVHF